MMYDNSAFSFGFALHWVFMFVTLLGLVAGVVWMVRFASKAQLKTWFWVGLLLGLVGSWLTFGAAVEGMEGMMSGWREYDEEYEDSEDGDLDDRVESMEEWRDEMMDLDDDEEEEDEFTEYEGQ